MSRKGVQDGVKDGGPHGSTHERRIESELFVGDSLFENGISFSSQNAHIEAPASSIQNGGHSENSECAVAELLTECDESFSVSENSAIWLKSKCKHSAGSDDCDFGCVVKDDQCHSDNDLFQGHVPAEEEGGRIVSSEDDLGDQVEHGDKSNTVPSEEFSDQGVTVHFDEYPSANFKDGHQEVFPLNIMQNFRVKSDSVALMTPQELESLPNRGLEFEDSLVSITYSSPNYPATDQHSNTNSCKSELNTLSPSNQGNIKCQMLNTPNEISSECRTSVVSGSGHSDCTRKETLNTDANSKHAVLEDCPPCTPPLSPSSSSSTATSSSQSVPTDSKVDPANLTLATISISTDKAANSTQILVNTNQGQQLYLINTADLTQATNALQPLAQPAVSNKTSSDVFISPASNSSPDNPELPDQASGQSLPLQIQGPGYFLLPVAQQEGNTGILVTTPFAAMPSEIVCQSRKVWMCPEGGCDKVFRKLSKLKIHQMRHTGERPFKCSRNGCDWAFTTAYKLKRHEESHEGRKDYNCDFPGCGRKFTTVYNLNSHRKLHERPCTETCPEPCCGQSFPTKRQLDLHVRTHTGLEKTYKCPVSGCEKVFFSPNCMGSHTRVHLMDRQDLTCKFEGCGKVFDKQCRLKQHERRHTGEKPYVCQFQGCNWAFTTASKLKRHKAKHTGLRKWVCGVCNKGFMRAEHLKGHLVTHSGVKPFICPVEGCKARFTAKSSLYVHLKKHDASGKKITYHCPMEGCVRNYSSKAGLRNHILKHYISTPSGTDPSTALDWVPLLGGDDESLDSLVNNSPDAVAAVSSSSSSPGVVNNSLLTSVPSSSSEEKSLIQTEFVSADEDCLSAEQLSSSIVSQLIANNPLQTSVASGTTVTSSKLVSTVSGADTKLLQLSKGHTPPHALSKSQPKIAIAADTTGLSTVALENSSGSARTDYRSNHMLSERARRRWHRIKNGSLQDSDSNLTETAVTDKVEKSDEASALFPADMMSSTQGVMFRDPETGITYVQTQLLQDDPPHPALYDDSGSGETSDISVTGTVSFTGTTINLQDLK